MFIDIPKISLTGPLFPGRYGRQRADLNGVTFQNSNPYALLALKVHIYCKDNSHVSF
jgi:hypothetical protein